MFKSLLKPILSFSLVLFVGCGIGCTAAAGAAPVISPKAKLSMKDKVLIERYMRQWSAADPEVQKSIHLGLRNLAGKKRLQSVKDEQLMELNLLPPTPAFIATIAARYNIEYDFNRKGTDIFYGKKGEPIYPSNNGFIGEPELADIEPNKVLLDRFGAPRGSFVAFYGASFSSRALNKYDAEDLRLGKKEYHIYKINKTIPKVLIGAAAPWFGEKGGCIQCLLPKSVASFMGEANGNYLTEVKSVNEANRLAQAYQQKQSQP